MNIKQIRNATIIVEYANKRFLIDPMLAEKGTYPPFPGSVKQDQNNPVVSLPIPVDDIIRGVDAVILTHLHLDHFDEAAQRLLPKDYCQKILKCSFKMKKRQRKSKMSVSKM